MMVPETVVPFLSSIVTDSLFNFICSCTTFVYQSRKGREIREVREKRTRNLNRFKVVRANSTQEGGSAWLLYGRGIRTASEPFTSLRFC